VKNLRKSWKLIVLVAVVTTATIGHVVRSRAFTLIEILYLPAVQLVANQSAIVNVSNTSTESVEFIVDIYSASGTLLASKTVTLPAGQTFALPYLNRLSGNRTIRAVVSLGTASAAVSDLVAFDKTSGEIIAIVPAVKIT